MAADAGNPVAQRSLGYMYCTGTGVALDYGEAVRLTRLAAQQGYALAETDLGYMYEQGKGVPLDYVAAYTWYSAGKVDGDERALSRLKSLSQLMGHGQIDEAESALSKVEEARREIPTVRKVPTDVQSSTKSNSAIPIKH
jgi:TPR repeat protein